MILADIKILVIIMPERNIPRYVAILSVLFVASCLIGFYAPIPGKLEHFCKLIDTPVVLRHPCLVGRTFHASGIPLFGRPTPHFN
jgi:hypothetical protein